MNRQLLEKAKKDGTVLALARSGAFGGDRTDHFSMRPAVPVVLTSVVTGRGVYSSSPKKTMVTAKLLADRLGEVTVFDERDRPRETKVLDDGTIAKVVRNRDFEEEGGEEYVLDGAAHFEARDLLAPWDEYAPARNSHLERQRERAEERATRAADIDRRYKAVERALGHIPVAGERSQYGRRDPETGKHAMVPTVEIDLTTAERLAAWIEEAALQPAAEDAIAAFIKAVKESEPWKGLADMDDDELGKYARKALAS